MRIYVASLADYNAGRLHGVWIDCDGKSGDDIQTEVSTMLAASKEPVAEEWAIHDHEGFGSLIGESTSFDRVAELAELIEEHGEAFISYAENMGEEYATADGFHEAYQGEFDTLADWAEDFMEQTGGLLDMPENLRHHFDYESYGRDARLGGDIYKIGRFVFWNR
jgi:antirestriction protein